MHCYMYVNQTNETSKHFNPSETTPVLCFLHLLSSNTFALSHYHPYLMDDLAETLKRLQIDRGLSQIEIHMLVAPFSLSLSGNNHWGKPELKCES